MVWFLFLVSTSTRVRISKSGEAETVRSVALVVSGKVSMMYFLQHATLRRELYR